MTTNYRTPRTLQQIKDDPRVEDVSDERQLDSGIWVYLKDGWCDPYHDPKGWPDCNSLREDTVKALIPRLARIKPYVGPTI